MTNAPQNSNEDQTSEVQLLDQQTFEALLLSRDPLEVQERIYGTATRRVTQVVNRNTGVVYKLLTQ